MLMMAAGLFLIAALGGVTMAVMHFRGESPPPRALAVSHGVFALGGFTIALGFHWRGRMLPSSLVAGHGLLAVIAFLLLLTVAFAA